MMPLSRSDFVAASAGRDGTVAPGTEIVDDQGAPCHTARWIGHAIPLKHRSLTSI
jgi:hypothetical protein